MDEVIKKTFEDDDKVKQMCPEDETNSWNNKNETAYTLYNIL